MFGKRADGKKIKKIEPEFKLLPSIMEERSDAQVFFKDDIPLNSLDEYIDNKFKSEGIRLSYMEIIFAAIVRVISQRPQLNRFVVNGRTYKRNEIWISLTIKKSMTDDGEETTVKIPFTGSETIMQVKEKLYNEVMNNKDSSQENGTDKLANVLSFMPYWLVKIAVKFLKWLDKHGMLPKSIIDVSPFHSSAYVTNVGSLGIDAIYHHIYNFGTTSMFFAMGRKKKSYIYEDDQIKVEKCITVSFVGDERICDGHYFAQSFKLLRKYLKKPELLEETIEIKKDID